MSWSKARSYKAAGRSALLNSPISPGFRYVPPFLQLFFNANYIRVHDLSTGGAPSVWLRTFRYWSVAGLVSRSPEPWQGFSGRRKRPCESRGGPDAWSNGNIRYLELPMTTLSPAESAGRCCAHVFGALPGAPNPSSPQPRRISRPRPRS